MKEENNEKRKLRKRRGKRRGVKEKIFHYWCSKNTGSL
jgi:hypothetical protein